MTPSLDLRLLRQALSRDLTEADRGSIATFYDMTPELIAEARMLDETRGSGACLHYLQFFVAESRNEDAVLFQEEVVRGGRSLVSWGTDDRLVALAEAGPGVVTLDVAARLRHFDALDGDRWFRIEDPVRDTRAIPMSKEGPGIVYRNMKYWSRVDLQGHARQLSVTYLGSASVAKIEDERAGIEVRRWVAETAAWYAKGYLLAEASPTPEGILASLSGSFTPSPDGWIALRALAREAVSGDPRWPSEPGRIGPDDWYRDVAA